MPTKNHPNRFLKRNLMTLSLVSFFIYLLPYTPISVILFEKLTGSYLLATSVFAVMRISLAFFEVPTGVLSDKWGRRKTLIIGCGCCFMHAVFLALALQSSHPLWFLYGAALSQAMAQALYSGNNEALIYETLFSLKCSHQYPKAIGRMGSMTQAGLAVSAAFCAIILLSGFSSDMLIYASLATSLALTACSLMIIEPPRKDVSEDHSFAHIVKAFQEIKKNDRLKLYSLVTMYQSGSAEANYLFSPGFIGSVWSEATTGIYRAAQHVLGGVSAWHAGHFVKKLGVPYMLIGTTVIIYGIWIVACLINNETSPWVLMAAPLFFSVWATAKSTLEQTSFTPKQRATMGSLLNLGSSIVTAVLCLIAGLLADHFPIHIALLIMLTLSSIIIIGGYVLVYRKYK